MDKRDREQTPLSKKDFLVVEETPNEALIYDSVKNKLHALSPEATTVWKNCDGKTSVSDIARKLKPELSQELSEDVTWLALEELERSGLLEASVSVPQESVSRRAMVKTAAMAFAVSLTFVTTLIAPTPARAQSGGGMGDMMMDMMMDMMAVN
jgi:hypothetical protein